jgi:HicB_like antitoxin of bacterial toxin-antitoxin system
MAHYMALIHNDVNSCYGVSFPDVPGVFTAGDTIDEAIRKAAEVWSLPQRIGRTSVVISFLLLAQSMHCALSGIFRSRRETP